jgi:hypothetical protein
MENNNTPQQLTANSHILSQLAAAKGCSIKIEARYESSPELGLRILVQEDKAGWCWRVYNTYGAEFNAPAYYETTWNMASGKTRRNWGSSWKFLGRIGYEDPTFADMTKTTASK